MTHALGARTRRPVFDAVLGVVPSDPLDVYEEKGLGALLADYYNPLGAFARVYCLSPLETVARVTHGLEVIPTLQAELPARIRECHIDIIRAYGGYWPCTYLCGIAAVDVPRVVSVHDTNPALLHDEVRFAARVFAVSAAVRACLVERGVAPHRLRMLPNRLDLRTFRPEAPAPPLFDELRTRGARHIVLHVGRRSVQKNLEGVIRALAELEAGYWAVFVGPGDDAPYRALAESVGVASRCAWLGSVENHHLPGYYGAASCVCMPSRWEGFGIVFIEALASGAAVVASDIAPLNEYMRHGRDALLVADVEDPHAIAGAIRRACEDPALARHLRQHAPRAALPFDRRSIDALEVGLYAELLGARWPEDTHDGMR